MALGVTYTIGVNGQQGLGVLSLFENKFKELGNTVKSELTSKLKGAVTLATIEEATRRSGEWSQQLERVAQTEGVASDKLQGLNLLAALANVENEKAIQFLDELDGKRRDAINGNQDLVQSFAALGITIQDLQHLSKADLFGKLLSSGSIPSLVAGTPLGTAAENLVGVGNIPTLQALNKASGGQNLNAFTSNAEEQGEIVSPEDTAAMADAWKEVKVNLQQTLVELAPVGKLFLSVANMLSEILLGVVRLFGHLFGIIKGLATGDMGGVLSNAKGLFAGLLTNAIFGIVKMITGILDLVSTSLNNWAKKIPLIGKYLADNPLSYTSVVQKQQDKFNKWAGISRADIKGGEGVGDLATLIGTEGVGTIAKAGSKVALDAATTAEKAGALGLADKTLNASAFLEKFGGNKGFLGGFMEKLGLIRTVGVGLGVAGLAANGRAQAGGPGTSADAPFNGFRMNQPATVFTGEQASMLKLGGTFGTGIQSRIVRLNEQMVTILAQIQRNTAYNNFNQTAFGGNNSNPNNNYSGGF